MVIRIGLLLPLMAVLFKGIAQEKPGKEINVETKIKDVTVFLRGAELHREAEVQLNAGNNLLKFEGLERNLDGNSIQVGGNKEFTIVSVNHAANYMQDPTISPKFRTIQDSLTDMEFKLELRKRFLSVYENEKKLILANMEVGGSQTGLDVEDLIEVADLYRTRLKEIEMKMLDISEEQKEFQTTVDRLNRQLNKLNANRYKGTTDIVVRISSKVRTTAKIFLSYVVYEAGWLPVYDVRAKDLKSPVNLIYKGNVWQNTGEDWDNVDLTLSTGNPSVSNTAPTVRPWVLQFGYANGNFLRGRSSNKRMVMNSAEAYADDLEEAESEKMDFAVVAAPPPVVVNNSGVSTEFKITIPYTIVADGEYYAVEIQSHELPATYEYFVAPKFDKDAFLMARVTDWDQYNLLSGEANIYYEGTYVGNSYLNASTTKDTIDLSLGRDKGVIVKREKIKDYGQNQVIGGNRKTTLGIRITVRNSKGAPVSILVHDQIPISQQKEIEVNTIETSGAEYNETTGALKWRMNLGAGQSESVELKYQVKYPKDRTIGNL